eukprot:TRINITY_DN3608_c0_g1_i8.p3 TRINITY_DN3608_c0_g1~~TRINITY_DN3608_c0_g1_i8.p3  ORF type:complete len:108 (+),score=34.99 TRINITY_DN3608_c0_g1_i8:211-534(+)
MATEPVGTLCYAAPEILLGSKYNRSVDLWSLGVLTYWLLSGCLPFSPDLPEKEIAERIISRDLKYNELRWKSVSEEAKNLVKNLLMRNPAKRITAEGVLKDPWINSE